MARLIAAALLALLLASPARADTLYQDLGERPNLVRVIDGAMARWLKDDRIREEFDNVNIDWLKGRLVDFFCKTVGGPCQYRGRTMYLAHKGLHLDTAKFNALVEDLQDSMDECGIPFRTQNRLLALLAPLERDIVTK